MSRLACRTSPVLILTAIGTAALAQTASAPPTKVSGVTVTAPAPTLPKVVSTFPADGKSVASGALILTVTFDQKMNPDGWDYGKGADAYPSCLARPRLLADEKTFVLLCTAPSNARFSVTLNSAAGGQGAFENLAGQKATPATFNFTTEDKALVTIPEAMTAAGLKPDQGPVMDIKPASVATAAH